MANGNLLVNSLRGALTPLVLEKQRQQQLEDELTANEQRAQLEALLEEFKQQGRVNIQTQKDVAAEERGAARDVSREERRDSAATDALKKALRLSRVGNRQERRAERQEFRRDAPERERKAREGDALTEQRRASADASRARAERDRRGPVEKPPKPEKISTFDGFKQEVSNEVTRMMKNRVKARRPMDELRAEAVTRIVARNGGNLGALDPSKMSERDIFNALRASLSGQESSKTMAEINAEVLGGQ